MLYITYWWRPVEKVVASFHKKNLIEGERDTTPHITIIRRLVVQAGAAHRELDQDRVAVSNAEPY